MAAKASRGSWIWGVSYDTNPTNMVRLEAGGTATLKCGTPLQLKVEISPDTKPALLDLVSSGYSSQKLDIQTQVVGVGGEVYSGFYRNESARDPAPVKAPRFEVTNQRGWRIGSGKMDRDPKGMYKTKWAVPARYSGQRVSVTVQFDLGPLSPDGKPLRSERLAVRL